MSKQLNTTWLLEFMGQISALLRKAGPLKPAGPAIPFLMDVFNSDILVLTETDSLMVPSNQNCVSRACWLASQHPGIAVQVAEWCLQLKRRHRRLAARTTEGFLKN